MAKPVLIAHALGEENLAELLAAPLRSAGYLTIHEGTILVGNSYIAEATKHLTIGTPIVVCCTVRAVGTPQVRRILNAARWQHHYSNAFVVQMEPEADIDALAFGEMITRYWADPDEAIRELLTALKRLYLGENDLSVTLGRQSVQRRSFSTLPAPLNTFVGRTQELSEAVGLLGAHRLLTFTGPAGSGKTRLALRVAEQLLWEFGDGVWFVALETISTSAHLPRSIGAVLGIEDRPGRDLLQTIVNYIRPRSMLLVLDTCEHLAAASIIQGLLGACAGLKIIATSRELVGVPGEYRFLVPPLPVPNTDSYEEVLHSEAGQLFLTRAKAVRQSFNLRLEFHSVAQICRRLDGIPLAIEIAAARVRNLSAAEVLEMLTDRLRLLGERALTAHPRHRTLTALFDWSYQLLSEQERKVFRQVATFVGGCTASAAARVCELICNSRLQDVLGALADKSLLVAEPDIRETRYRMLQTLREYALQRLTESLEDRSTHERYLQWCVGFVEEAAPQLITSGQIEWFDRIAAELDNLRAALEWSRTSAEHAFAGLRIAVGLGRYWLARGHAAEAREWLSDALARTDTVPSAIRATALNWAGNLEMEFGDLLAARAFGESSLEMAEACGDQASLAFAARHLAMTVAALGDDERAERLLERAIELATKTEDKREVGFSLTQLGELLSGKGNLTVGAEMLSRGRKCLQAAGDRIGLIANIRASAQLAISSGRIIDAKSYLTTALEFARALGYKVLIAWTLIDLASVLRAEGELELAGDQLTQALSIAVDNGTPESINDAVRTIAGLFSDHGQFDAAARLFAAERSWRGQAYILSGFRHAQYERDIEKTKTRLGDVAFEKHWAAGESMPVSKGVEYAGDLLSTLLSISPRM